MKEAEPQVITAEKPTPPKPRRIVALWKRLDKGLVSLCVVFLLTMPLFTARIYASDEIQYFSYLHSVVFDFDVNFTNEYEHFIALDPKKYEGFKKDLLDKRNENGLPINVAPIGSALLWSPFYLVAHGISSIGSAVGIKAFNPNGYSPFYIFSVTFASLLYGFAGLILCYRLARNFFSVFWSAFGCIIIWLASPLIFYMSLTPPMSHANSLFAISLWLYVWYRTRGWQIDDTGKFMPGQRSLKAWLALGLLGALCTMVREQDGSIMIVAAIEALYCYAIWLRERIYWSKIRHLFVGNVLLLLGLVIGIIPQLITYYYLNGHPSPSTIVGNKLRFFSPQLFGLMFDPDHGMFLWAPILIPALAGVIMMLFNRKMRFLGIVLLAAFVAELYISASFQTWTMAGSYGARRMIGVSAVYILGISYLGWTLAQNRAVWRRRLLVGIGVLFILWNFGVIVQFSAIRTTDDRQNFDPGRTVHDQFTVVPGKLLDTATKFFSDRSGFYKKQ